LVLDVDLEDGVGQISLRVDEARELSGVIPPRPVMGVFVAWCAARDLLDAARFEAHARLLGDVKARRATGGALLDAALARGLWDRHLVDRPGLRDFAYGWFHNIGKQGYIRDTFVQAFGGRMGKHGHEEAVLDDESWAAVDKASPPLDRTFARWVGRSAGRSAAGDDAP
jgi:hypothetical protein